MHELRFQAATVGILGVLPEESDLVRLLSLFLYTFTLLLVWRCLSRRTARGTTLLVGINISIHMVSYGILWKATRTSEPPAHRVQVAADASVKESTQVEDEGGTP